MSRAVGGEFPGGYDAWLAANPDGQPADYIREWDGELVDDGSGSVVQLRHGGHPWPAPCALDGTTRPPFPTQALPPSVRRFVEAVAASTQTPADLAACFALSAVATLTGGRVWVQPWEGWLEPTNLWALPVLPPANRKSPVLREVAGPLREIERDLAERARPGIAEAEMQREIAEKRMKRAADDAAKAEGANRMDAEAHAIGARQAYESLSVPTEPRLLAGDVTPEKAAVLLAEQGGRLGILIAEGGLFGTLSGRYSNGQANLDVFLQAWSGDPVTVDRMGRSRLFVPRPALTLCLAVQPDMLRQVAANPALRGLGLLGRFLYALPTSLVGGRTAQGPTVPQELRDDWRTLLASLADLPVPAEDVTPSLSLTEAAGDLFRAFTDEIEPQLHADTGDLGAITDWAGKLVGTTARLAALLHLAHHGVSGLDVPIDEASIRGAIQIARYAIPHALAAFGAMGARQDLGPADALLRWIQRGRRPSFSVRDAWQNVKQQSAFPNTDAVRAAVKVLAEYGWVRSADQTAPKAGRPTELYDVNPAVWRPHYPHSPRNAVHPAGSGVSGDVGVTAGGVL